jgi:hypothetical protein
MKRAIPVLVGVPCALVSCASVGAGDVRVRAAWDLGCDPSNLQVVEIDSETRGISGCGKKATYVQQCRFENNIGVRTGCNWTLNLK